MGMFSILDLVSPLTLLSTMSLKFLGVYLNRNPENGATIQIWDSRDPTTDNKNQLWNFSRV